VKFSFEGNYQTLSVDLTPSGSGRSYRATIGDKTIDVETIRSENGKLDLLIGGKHLTAYVSSDNTKHWITINGQTLVLTKSAAGTKRNSGKHDHAGELTAPMPGQVRAVNVGEGDTVTKSQTLLVIEAMKMEIRIHASRDGKVKKLFVKQGQTVERDQVLIEIE